MKYVFTLLLFLLSLLITSCKSITIGDSSKTKAFESLYADCSMNSEVVFVPLQPNYKTEDFIMVNYQNVSKSEVAFLEDSGLKIYAFDPGENAWVEIKNGTHYAEQPEEYAVLEPSSDLSSYGSTIFSPEFYGERPKEIRVAITGFLYKDGVITDNCVGAFLDLTP